MAPVCMLMFVGSVGEMASSRAIAIAMATSSTLVAFVVATTRVKAAPIPMHATMSPRLQWMTVHASLKGATTKRRATSTQPILAP